MNTRQRQKITDMLFSKDPEMRDLGVLFFQENVTEWEDYLYLRSFMEYGRLPAAVRCIIRRTMINTHGKLRSKFKIHEKGSSRKAS